MYYSVDGNNWLLLTTFDGLSTGSYSVYARDSEGLNASIVVNLVQSESMNYIIIIYYFLLFYWF